MPGPTMTLTSQDSSNGGDSSMQRGTTPPAFYVRTNRISCDPCRRRKLKCDRVKPCSTCQRRGIADQCYQEDRERPAEDNSISLPSKRPKPSVSYLDESKVRRASDTTSPTSLSSSLSQQKEQWEAIAKMASTSSQSLDALISSLPSSTKHNTMSPSIIKSDLITWAQVSDELPSVKDCEDLITFYFEELTTYIRISQRSAFESHWRQLIVGNGIAAVEASIIFTGLALASIMLPAGSSIKRHSRQDQYRWMTLLGDPLGSPSHGDAVDNSFSKIQLLGLTSIYHLYEGRSDRMWECVGVTMRKGIVFGLFDERRKSWAGLDNLEKEYRRRLAWYMLSLERWQAFVRQLPFALHPSYVYLAEAAFEPDYRVSRSTRPASIVPNRPHYLPDGRLQTHISARRSGAVKFVHVELLAWCQEYLDQFASMEPARRYSQALLLDDVLERVLVDGLHNTGIQVQELRFLSTEILDQCVKERQVEVNLWVSSIFFLRCIITRRFLMDDNAPSNLRFASLTYAQGILATIPSLTRLLKIGDRPVQTTWNANHLLAAATTFTVVILGQDLYVESQPNPLEADTSQSKPSTFPNEQMDWLADNIFITLEGLETFVQVGNHTASVAKQLLERLCGTQSDLRSLYLLRFNKIAEGENQQQQQQQHQTDYHNQMAPLSAYRHEPQLVSGSPAFVSSGAFDPLKNVARSDRDKFHAVVMQPSPSPSTAAATASPSGSISNFDYANQWSTPSALHPMSASSLLDAVLMDPTELDFLGSGNHSDLLASLLQDSPPI